MSSPIFSSFYSTKTLTVKLNVRSEFQKKWIWFPPLSFLPEILQKWKQTLRLKIIRLNLIHSVLPF